MLTNTLILLGVIAVIVLLIRFYKKISEDDNPIPPGKTACNFTITSPRFNTQGNKKIAHYSIEINNKYHVFFIDFPMLFKFYSEENFKTKVRISYTVPKEPKSQEIMNKELVFTGDIKEYKYFITDIIIGKIDIEIELNISYGNPSISFEILPNELCILEKEHKIEIKFPE